jgi:hypothetical protein
MRSERGQATVEWIGLLLLVTLALAALSHLAPRADGRTLATSLLHSVTGRAHHSDRPRPALPTFSTQESSVVPPLVPRQGGVRSRTGPRLPALPAALRRARRGAGALWRRAWFACLVYERTRYAVFHPESRLPGYTIPLPVAFRMATNCVSPVDLVRDWPLLDGDR